MFILLRVLTINFTGISQVVEGDLVYDKECPSGEAASVYTSEADDGHAVSSEIDLCSETQPEEMIQSVKVCYRYMTCLYTKILFLRILISTFYLFF
jgi:hypothetical protein